MDLNEYIKMSYKRPNRKVLEGLGASESLIEYLMETPWNTNWNVIGSIANPGEGGDAEVWFVGDEYEDENGSRMFQLSNADATDHITELYNHAENYTVYLNGEELEYLIDDREAANIVAFADGPDIASSTKAVFYEKDTTAMATLSAIATWKDASVAPTSVEVSVKAK